LAEYGRNIDDLRAALDWAFSPEGNAATGIALTAAAVPLWMHLSLLEECRDRVERALSTPGADRDARREMKLYTALAASSLYSKGAAHEFGAAWQKALDIAEDLTRCRIPIALALGFVGVSPCHRGMASHSGDSTKVRLAGSSPTRPE
jgi:hypothetical protein